MDAHWTQAISDFLSAVEDHSGSVRSRATYAYILNRFFSDEYNPDEYTQSDVRTFLDAPSGSNYHKGQLVQPATKNQRLMCLSSFYKFASTYLTNGSPLLTTKPPTYGLKYLKTASSPRALTADEIERFFAAIDTSDVKGVRDHAIFLTYFHTAKRRSEIARLTVGDIQQAMLIDKDGTRRAGHVFSYRAKGRSRIVALAELPQLAYDSIVRYWRDSGRLDALKPDSPVFASTRPDQPEQQITGDYINALFKFYAAKAGLDSRYSLHTLRHSSARQRYELGSDPVAIQEVLDHTSLGTTTLYLKSITGASDPGAKLLQERFKNL
jgi:integrase/recombinase XerD